jgi:hypothetical protein
VTIYWRIACGKPNSLSFVLEISISSSINLVFTVQGFLCFLFTIHSLVSHVCIVNIDITYLYSFMLCLKTKTKKQN